MDIDLEQLRDLMRAMAEFQMNDLELEKAGERISLKRGGAVVSVSALASAPGALPSIPPAAQGGPGSGSVAPPPAEEDDANTQWITSPFVGTYYAAPSPGAAPFVKTGQSISPGTVLCIVEAMKLMNEIESEVAGVIMEIASVNGKPVEYGDKLFKIKVA